jgi:TPR repeat protein
MYDDGRGVEKDEAEAVQWYRKAAEQGAAIAQNNLGEMYRIGRGVEQDDAEAVMWYQKAADQGNEGAKKRLEELKARRIGLPTACQAANIV